MGFWERRAFVFLEEVMETNCLSLTLTLVQSKAAPAQCYWQSSSAQKESQPWNRVNTVHTEMEIT